MNINKKCTRKVLGLDIKTDPDRPFYCHLSVTGWVPSMEVMNGLVEEALKDFPHLKPCEMRINVNQSKGLTLLSFIILPRKDISVPETYERT